MKANVSLKAPRMKLRDLKLQCQNIFLVDPKLSSPWPYPSVPCSLNWLKTWIYEEEAHYSRMVSMCLRIINPFPLAVRLHFLAVCLHFIRWFFLERKKCLLRWHPRSRHRNSLRCSKQRRTTGSERPLSKSGFQQSPCISIADRLYSQRGSQICF